MERAILFLDDGGVMNDGRVRAPQWQRLVGQFFAPRLGGTPPAWEEANRVVFGGMFDPLAWEDRLRAASSYDDFERTYFVDWLGGMCRMLGVTEPPEDDMLDLSCEASAWIVKQVRAAFPGAAEAIKLLHGNGYTLCTASGESSMDLEGYLSGMGVRKCFQRLYGPDLVDTFKMGPEYYERIFADADVRAADALVLDDSPAAVSWAIEAGAHTVLVGAAQADGVQTIGSLAELPAWLEQAG